METGVYTLRPIVTLLDKIADPQGSLSFEAVSMPDPQPKAQQKWHQDCRRWEQGFVSGLMRPPLLCLGPLAMLACPWSQKQRDRESLGGGGQRALNQVPIIDR